MDLRAALAVHRLVAIVRGDDADAALRTVLTLAEEGVELIEVSLTGKDALRVIERARAALGPDRPLGAGRSSPRTTRWPPTEPAPTSRSRRVWGRSRRPANGACPSWPVS